MNNCVEAVKNICAWWTEALASDVGMGVLPAQEAVEERGGEIRAKIGEEAWSEIAKSIENLVHLARDIDKPVVTRE